MISTPSSLYPGARVALLAPASPSPAERLEKAVAGLKFLGLEPVVYPSCRLENRHGYFAADDGQRAKDLQDAFADPDIRGIFCLRGGYGTTRLLPLLNWREIARHPKPLFGYSDITALHLALNQSCRMVSYHAPFPSSAREGMDQFTLAYLRRALFGALTGPMPLGEGVVTLQGGQAKGPLCGGNLTVAAQSLGTPWEIDTWGRILFLEDVGEPVQQLDAALTQLRNAGKLDECAGILLGQWVDCPADPDGLTLEDLFEELLLPTGKPILAGLPCGHSKPTMSLPLGATATLDADRQTLEVLG